MNIGVAATDLRRVDLIAYGLPIYYGLPIAGDTTFVSPVTGAGEPIAKKASTQAGVAIERAVDRKHSKYPEFWLRRDTPAAHFLPLANEVGGRWGEECIEVVRLLAKCKARSAPECLGKSVEYAYLARWWAMLSVTSQATLSASLVDYQDYYFPDSVEANDMTDNVLHASVYEDGPGVSRMGA